MAAPRTKRTQDTRDRILEAAIECFAEAGYGGARTREIATRADANLGLIQYYFGGKENLWKAAVTFVFEELGREIVRVTEEGGGEVPPIEELLRAYVRFMARRPHFVRLMNDEGRCDTERLRWLTQTHLTPLWKASKALIERAQADGVLPPGPPLSFFYILAGAVGMVFSQAPEARLISGRSTTSPRFVAEHEEALVGLVRALATAARP